MRLIDGGELIEFVQAFCEGCANSERKCAACAVGKTIDHISSVDGVTVNFDNIMSFYCYLIDTAGGD